MQKKMKSDNQIILRCYTGFKKQNEMNGSVKDIVKRHHACREELPEKYATKKTVDKIFDL